MKKDFVIKLFGILLYVLIVLALSIFFAYKEWNTLLFITIIFLPLFLLPAIKNVFVRILSLIGFWALLISGVLYLNSNFTHIIIVNGESEYTVKKVPRNSKYEYFDRNGNTKSIIVKDNCVHNQIDKSLRLYEASYSQFQPMFGGSVEQKGIDIPTYSVVTIPIYPDYILESPPNSINVRKHRFNTTQKDVVKTVLEVVE